MARGACGALYAFLALIAISSTSAKCGVRSDCPRTYSLSEVNRSALAGDSYNGTRVVLAKQLPDLSIAAAHARCRHKVFANGGWCYTSPETVNGDIVPLSSGGSFYFPYDHLPADSPLVALLLELLRVGRTPTLSLNDFGAGVGMYGMALAAHDPSVRYRGYDGGANVEAASYGRVSYFDLAQPLRLPMADWVMSTEVGEHVPNQFEGTVMRNLHAHNCRGIVLSWARLGQGGKQHVNCHSSEYIVELFQGLGYVYDVELTDRVRRGGVPPSFRELWLPSASVISRAREQDKRWAHPSILDNSTGIVKLRWLRKTLHVFRRLTPLRHPECTPPSLSFPGAHES